MKIPLLLIVLSLLTLKFLYQPYGEKLTQKKALLQAQLELYEQKLKTLSSTLQDVSENTEHVTSFEEVRSKLFSSDEDPFIIQLKVAKDLEKEAKRRKIQVETLELLSLGFGKSITELPLQFTLKGETKALLDYLSFIDQYFAKKGKFFSLRELSLSEMDNQLRITLKLSFYRADL